MAAPSKRSKEDGPPLVVFRLLCPSARTGSIIGKVQTNPAGRQCCFAMAAPPLPRFSTAALAARHSVRSEAEHPAHAGSNLLLSWDAILQRRSRTQSAEGMCWARAMALKPLQPFSSLPASRSLSAVLQGGDIIRQLRAETGSRIKIEEAVDRCDERIVAISAPER